MPNAETVEAMREVQQMKADPSLGKTYNNVDQMMEGTLFSWQKGYERSAERFSVKWDCLMRGLSENSEKIFP